MVPPKNTVFTILFAISTRQPNPTIEKPLPSTHIATADRANFYAMPQFGGLSENSKTAVAPHNEKSPKNTLPFET